ncbi:MAG: SDR family oxidoreductase [Candidatus Thermoplasmatota archaeon]|nr:SDR family oxidoreductase [Candidatus Thermoplasmatota archaeon]
MRLSDKTAVVFGCNGTIAKAICKKLSQEGCKIVVTDLKKDLAEQLVSEINNAVGIGADVRIEKDVKKVINLALKKFGKIDVAINCSRIALLKETIEFSEKEWDTIVDFNAKSMYLIAKSVLKNMIDNNSGSIIGITSKAAKSGPANFSAYAASMNASIGLLRSLSCEVRNNNIQVNALCPGYIEHEELALGAELTGNKSPDKGIYVQFSPLIDITNEPEALANLVAYLASDEGRFITGQAYHLCDDDVTYWRNLGLEAEM